MNTDAPVFLARAPGRLDVMGGIADYSGSLVLQMPIAEACRVYAQATPEPTVRVHSRSPTGGEAREVRLGLADLAGCSYDDAHESFRADPSQAWVAYVAGVLLVLERERGMSLDHGWCLWVQSDVPEGKGVSSSAALEVATMQAVTAAAGLTLDGVELATLCQIVENRVVGAPCGIMDQMTVSLGRADQLLALLCQPAMVEGYRPLPDSLRVWGIDSGIRHAVSGSDYTDVRTGAFMGWRILSELRGDAECRGYLANVPRDEFFEEYAQRIPVRMGGEEFLRRYQGTADPVTRVRPDRDYAVRQPTTHPILEHHRVRRFAQLLEGEVDAAGRAELGELMAGSHDSYSACGLGSDGTDLLVQLVRERGAAQGLYGARITGGGCGGTVAILGDSTADRAVRDIARTYQERTGRSAQVFAGSSDGAGRTGVTRVAAPAR